MLGSAGAGWLLLGAQLGASLVCGLAAALFVRLRKRSSMAGRFRAAVACAAQTGKGMPAGRCSVPQKTQPDAVPSQTGFVPAVRDSVNAIVMLCGYVTLFSFFAAIAVPTGADASVRFWPRCLWRSPARAAPPARLHPPGAHSYAAPHSV